MLEIKRIDFTFLRNLFIATVIVSFISAYPLINFALPSQIYSIFWGFLISLINTLIGYTMNEISFQKSMKNFLVIVFGGIGIRFLISAIMILLLLHFFELEDIPLLASVIFFYFLFTGIEIHSLVKKSKGKLNLKLS